MSFTESDLRFVAETIASSPQKREEALRVLRERSDLLEDLLENPRIFDRIWREEETLVRISPYLLFHILLRQVRRFLHERLYVYEVGTRGERLPVFEAPQVAELLEDREVLDYLAHMLASFARTQSGVIYWEEGGHWRKRRISDIDMDDMIFLARLVEPALRPLLMKRVADIALFLSGIYPEHASLFIARPKTAFTAKRTIRDYENEGTTFYRIASEQLDDPRMQRTCRRLSESFTLARRALNTLSEEYLARLQERLGGSALGEN